jgi:hypothetical protein
MLYALQANFEAAAAKAQEPPPKPTSEPSHRVVSSEPAVTDAARDVSARIASALPVADAQRRRADQLLKAGDVAGLRSLAEPSDDPYVRRRLVRLYVRRHDVQALKELAAISNAACKALAQMLADYGAVEELCHQVVCGNGFARHIIESRPIAGLQDEERARILKQGLNPDGTVANNY